jgi:hypothetical protein
MVIDTRPQAGDGFEILVRGRIGRHDAVLARSEGPAPHSFAIYVRPESDRRFSQRTFKEGHALMLLGFAPRPRCKFFVRGCALAGGFELIVPTIGGPGGEDRARALFAALQDGLDSILDRIADAIAAGQDLGLAPTPPSATR